MGRLITVGAWADGSRHWARWLTAGGLTESCSFSYEAEMACGRLLDVRVRPRQVPSELTCPDCQAELAAVWLARDDEDDEEVEFDPYWHGELL